jgi:hypothetical protein
MADKPDRRRRWRKRVGGLAILAILCWFVIRVLEFGILNVFFRDHHFTGHGQLTEALAIDLTRQTLEREWFDVSSMKPESVWNDRTQLFSRNTINPNRGMVHWVDRLHGPPWGYDVTIEKNDSDVCCRVYRPK